MPTSPTTSKPYYRPTGYQSVTPYLAVSGAAEAIKFYKKAFGAKELFRLENDGKVAHAEIEIDGARLMLADEFPNLNFHAPDAARGASINLALYVPDADATFRQAIAAGAKEVRPVEDQFYGDRVGQITDPFGHSWSIMTHVEDVSADEMRRRHKEKVGAG